MPLRLDIRRELTARSDRIKSVDLHPSEPWVLCSLYSGHVHVWNTQSQTLIKTFEVCDLPVRAAKFVPRKNWVISGEFLVFFTEALFTTFTFRHRNRYVESLGVLKVSQKVKRPF